MADFVEHMAVEDDNVKLMVHTYGCSGLNGGEFPIFSQDRFGANDFSREELNKHIPRLCVAVLWYYCCLYANNVSQAWLQANVAGFYEAQWGHSQPDYQAAMAALKNYNPDVYKGRWGDLPPSATVAVNPEAMQKYYQNKTVVLYDFVFLHLPEISGSFPADCFAGISCIFCAVRFVVIPGPMSMRWTLVTRVLIVWGALMLCRAFCIIVTPLPNPFHQCVPSITFPDNIWLEAYANLPGVFWHSELTCQDVMFSGHACMGTIFTLFSWRYLKRAPWYPPHATASLNLLTDVIAMVWLLCGWYVICASHFHYTVDVMVAALLSFTVWNGYHTLTKTVWLKEGDFSAKITAPFLMWFERHSVDLRYWRSQAQRLMTRRVGEKRWTTWRNDREVEMALRGAPLSPMRQP